MREMDLPRELAEATAIDAALLKLDEVYEARQVHACTHTPRSLRPSSMAGTRRISFPIS